jgi:hypothetical protein
MGPDACILLIGGGAGRWKGLVLQPLCLCVRENKLNRGVACWLFCHPGGLMKSSQMKLHYQLFLYQAPDLEGQIFVVIVCKAHAFFFPKTTFVSFLKVNLSFI